MARRPSRRTQWDPTPQPLNTCVSGGAGSTTELSPTPCLVRGQCDHKVRGRGVSEGAGCIYHEQCYLTVKDQKNCQKSKSTCEFRHEGRETKSAISDSV